jgi:hypothetical protein
VKRPKKLYSPILMMQRRLSPLSIRSNAVLISENGTLCVMNFSSINSYNKAPQIDQSGNTL